MTIKDLKAELEAYPDDAEVTAAAITVKTKDRTSWLKYAKPRLRGQEST